MEEKKESLSDRILKEIKNLETSSKNKIGFKKEDKSEYHGVLVEQLIPLITTPENEIMDSLKSLWFEDKIMLNYDDLDRLYSNLNEDQKKEYTVAFFYGKTSGLYVKRNEK